MRGKRVHVLRSPDGTPRYPGVERNATYGVVIYTCPPDRLPGALEPFRPPAHSWEAAVERTLNGEVLNWPGKPTPITLRDYQAPRVEDIVAAHRHSKGGYTLAYPVGSGKTLTSIAAVNRMQVRTVLVIARVTHLTAWRAAIERHGRRDIEWVVINPERLGCLFAAIDGEEIQTLDPIRRDERAAVDGVPFFAWDVVVTDEAHILANPTSNRSRLWRRAVRWPEDGGTFPEAFTLNLSATPWSNPLETSSAAHIMASAEGVPVPDEWTLDVEYADWLRAALGFHMYPGRGTRRWHWEENPDDVQRVHHLVFSDGRGASKTARELGLPGQARRLEPIVISNEERQTYEASWLRFRTLQGLPTKAYLEPDTGLSEALRNVQKASLIKVRHVARLVEQYIEDGYQVVLPTWYEESSMALAKACYERLNRLGLKVARVTGEDSPSRRDALIRAFQSGRASVIVTSSLESINLHAGEKRGGENDEDATTTPRVTIFMDVLTGGKKTFQAEGRAQRDGQRAEAIYTYVPDTTEQKWLCRVLRASANTKALSEVAMDPLSDADIAALEAMADELDDSDEEEGPTP